MECELNRNYPDIYHFLNTYKYQEIALTQARRIR